MDEPRTYPIPIAPGRDLLITGPFQITPADWDQFLAVLDVMKPGLVKPPAKRFAAPYRRYEA